MALFGSCQGSLLMIEEVLCPECGDVIELFTRDGKTVEKAICDTCGFTVDVDTPSSGYTPFDAANADKLN